IFHRGREMAHQEVSRKKMDRLLKDVGEFAMLELGPRREANILMALLAPKKGMPAAPPAAAPQTKPRSEQSPQEGTSG
ncbi:MAG: hypothetical protein ACRD5L_13335, partial [Bryobacteraceae bacterium]